MVLSEIQLNKPLSISASGVANMKSKLVLTCSYYSKCKKWKILMKMFSFVFFCLLQLLFASS